jgi:hypothetical protein
MTELPFALSPADHYQSPIQCALWQEVHDRYSPQGQASYREFYGNFFSRSGERLGSTCRGLILFGAGSGWKEAALVEAIGPQKLEWIKAIDAEASLLGLTEDKLRTAGFSGEFHGVVGDFLTAPLDTADPSLGLVALGILPNVEPEAFLCSLEQRLPAGVPVWLSANMTTPGRDVVLSQYRNPETEQWLEQFFIDRGLRHEQLNWRWTIHPCSFGWRVEGHVYFPEGADFEAGGLRRHYRAGDSLMAFYSNRMDPERWGQVLRERGFRVIDAREESGDGLWFCRSGG